jgi:hypothetical protein
MELEVNSDAVAVETVEVVAGGEDGAAAALMGQQLMVATTQDLIVPSPEPTALDVTGGALGLPVGTPASLSQSVQIGSKRPSAEISLSDLGPAADLQNLAYTGELPRKKSRNYLDSHKNIEKKRRDRINQCLNQLKVLVPDCRQYGNKKLDKAEILEMTIEHIHRLQPGGGARGVDVSFGQKEWVTDLTTWVIQNKILHTGPHSLDTFCQALLLHMQNLGSSSSISSATSLLVNQVRRRERCM